MPQAESEATSLWCPFALTQNTPAEATVSGDAKGDFTGTHVAVTVINRTVSGSPHPDCLCITTQCNWWRDVTDGKGFCSKLDDNAQGKFPGTSAAMEGRWCPLSRPEGAPVLRDWFGSIAGQDVSIASPNRSGAGPADGAKCIGDKCMAFRTNKVNSHGWCMAADRNMQRN